MEIGHSFCVSSGDLPRCVMGPHYYIIRIFPGTTGYLGSWQARIIPALFEGNPHESLRQ